MRKWVNLINKIYKINENNHETNNSCHFYVTKSLCDEIVEVVSKLACINMIKILELFF